MPMVFHVIISMGTIQRSNVAQAKDVHLHILGCRNSAFVVTLQCVIF